MDAAWNNERALWISHPVAATARWLERVPARFILNEVALDTVLTKSSRSLWGNVVPLVLNAFPAPVYASLGCAPS